MFMSCSFPRCLFQHSTPFPTVYERLLNEKIQQTSFLKNSFFILVKVFVTSQDSPPGEGHRCVWLARLLMVESLPPCQGVILADTPSVVTVVERNQRKFQLMLSLWPLLSIDTQFFCLCGKGLPKCRSSSRFLSFCEACFVSEDFHPFSSWVQASGIQGTHPDNGVT